MPQALPEFKLYKVSISVQRALTVEITGTGRRIACCGQPGEVCGALGGGLFRGATTGRLIISKAGGGGRGGERDGGLQPFLGGLDEVLVGLLAQRSGRRLNRALEHGLFAAPRIPS